MTLTGHSTFILATVIVLAVLNVFLVALRIWAKQLTRQRLAVDDILILVALVGTPFTLLPPKLNFASLYLG
jgi:hypothetical protein